MGAIFLVRRPAPRAGALTLLEACGLSSHQHRLDLRQDLFGFIQFQAECRRSEILDVSLQRDHLCCRRLGRRFAVFDYHLYSHFHQRIFTFSVSSHLLSPAAKRARRSFTAERSNISACSQKSIVAASSWYSPTRAS